MANGANQTHIEDVKDPDKVLPPSGNLVLVAFREDESGDYIPFALLDHLPLDPCHRPAIEASVSGSLCVCISGLLT